MTRPAVLLDRDGTLIEDAGYLSDPAGVVLLPGAAEGLKEIAHAGYALVLVSNQSGIARGMFDEEALGKVHDRLAELLNEHGVGLDGAYYCPFLDGPEAVVEAYRRDSDWRKPAPGMLREAAGDLGLDLSRSWMVGNSAADIAAGAAAGCRTVLVSALPVAPVMQPAPDFFVADLREAAEVITKSVPDAESPAVAAESGPMAEQPPSSKQSPAEPVADAGDRMESPEAVELLRGIHDQLDRAGRRSRQHDFSVLRLFGALLQMLAIVAALWGLPAMTGDQNDAAAARLALACFLQLASIAAFAHDHLR